MRRHRFRFNKETISYERVHINIRDIFRTLWIATGIGFVLALAVICKNFMLAHHPTEDSVSAQIAAIEQNIGATKKSFVQIQGRLNKLHHTDNTFYRSILTLDPIDQGVWDGGTGGSDRYQEVTPDALQQVCVLSDKLSYDFALQQSSFSKLEKFAEIKAQELKHIPAIRPVPGHVVGGFGYRHDPFHGNGQFHPGLDFDAKMGTPVYATGAGKVTIAGIPESGYGIQVEVNHGFGYATKYAHLSRLSVLVGQEVKRGELLGYSGSTGYSTGPHLHYEVIRQGTKVNPFDYFFTY